MASSQVVVDESDIRLKHLGFVRILAMNIVVLVSNIYDHAKQNSGSLKSTFDKVENAITTVVGPAYRRFKDVPTHFLIFLDNKVDKATQKFDERAPPAAKNVAFKAHLVVEKASQTVQELAEEAKVGGPLASLSRASTMSKHFAVSQLALLWYKINQHPTLHGVSDIALPRAADWSLKYNNMVKDLSAKGYKFFNYVPLVPVEEMAEAYNQVEAADCKKADKSISSESDSDKE